MYALDIVTQLSKCYIQSYDVLPMRLCLKNIILSLELII